MPVNPFAKSPKTGVTFSSTADAMRMEAVAQDENIPGRIIPVPSEIDAGCGLAWCCERAQASALLAEIIANDLAYEGVFEVELF